jgi:hypothetical protein
VIGGVGRASLWRGSAASWLDLTPAGSDGGIAYATHAGQQVGYADVGGQAHAALWSGTASSWLDLHGLLPPGYLASQARGIWHDGTFTYVVGFATLPVTFNEQAVMWVGCQGAEVLRQPNSVEVTPCQTAVFSIQTSADPVSYRWRRNGANLNNNSRISGAATPTLTISPVGYFLGGLYDVVLTNSCGSVISEQAQLILRDPADFDGDGDVGTDSDIEAFFACLAGECCARCLSADFNNDGDLGTDADIEAFFRVLGGGSC